MRVGILRKEINILGVKKLFVCHRAVFAVVKAVKCRHKAHLKAVVRQSVDIIFVLTIMVEKRTESADFLQYGNGNHPKCCIDKRKGGHKSAGIHSEAEH